MIGYDLGMHRAGVILHRFVLLSVLMLHLRAIGVNRLCLRGDICRERDGHR